MSKYCFSFKFTIFLDNFLQKHVKINKKKKHNSGSYYAIWIIFFPKIIFFKIKLKVDLLWRHFQVDLNTTLYYKYLNLSTAS